MNTDKMIDIRESMKFTPSLAEFIKEERVDEGLKDILNKLKRKFKQVTEFLFGFVAKISSKLSYWCPVTEEGNIMPAITPLTAGQAYSDGVINKESTLVFLGGRKGPRLTGCKTKLEDAEKLYGSGNSLDYWKRMLNESKERFGENMITEMKLRADDPQASYNVVDTPMLKTLIKAHIRNPKLPRLLIMGAPGIGKTAILKAVLSEVPGGSEFNMITKTLSNETPDNFTLPTYVYDESGKATAAEDVPKTWLPVYKPTGDENQDEMLSDACGKGLLFIDELSRATQQVQNVILPLINEGEFNGYKLGKNWQIICASNRMEDDLSSQTRLGNALANRFAIYYYQPTVKSWEEWAKTQGYISPLLLSWLNMPEHENMAGGKYFYWDPNETGEESESLIMCTPRSWTNAMQMICEYSNTASLEGFSILDIPKDILAIALNGAIPREAVDSFLAFLDVVRSIGNFDEAVYSVWKQAGKGFSIDKKNLRQVALPMAQLLITAHVDKLPTEEEFSNLCEWLVSTDSDQMASYVLDIMKEVFGGMLPEERRESIFKLRAAYEKLKATPSKDNDVKIKIWARSFESFTSKWGLTLDTVPDWYPGIVKLIKKYGNTFTSYKFDGKDALG